MDNFFKVFALGDDFDVDAFVATSSMVPSCIWRRGEPRRGGRTFYPNSGVAYEIADGYSIPFPQQENIAIAFLKANRDSLRALGQFPGVTHFTLGLQYSADAQRNLVGFAIGASPTLMWHLLDIGLCLTNYVWLQYQDLQSEA